MRSIVKPSASKPVAPAPQGDEYREWFDQQVQLGLDDLAAGRIVPHEELVSDIQKRRNERVRKQKKAA